MFDSEVLCIPLDISNAIRLLSELSNQASPRLIARADAVMYRAKYGGKSQYRFSSGDADAS
jgi:GGDEF domain-containing protein